MEFKLEQEFPLQLQQELQHMTCCQSGCSADSTWRAVLVLRPPAPAKGVVKTKTSIELCDAHKGNMTIGQLTDEAWESLCELFKASGRMLPDRASSSVQWESLS